MRKLTVVCLSLACGTVALGQTSWRNYYPSFRDIASDGERYIAVGDTMFLSEDGVQWEELTSAPVASNLWISVLFDGEKFVALDVAGQLTSSRDTANWTVRHLNDETELPPGVRYQGLHIVDGSIFVLSSHLLVTTNDVDWLSVAQTQEYEGFQVIAAGGGRTMVGGFRGTVAVSTNVVDPSSWSSSIPFGDRGIRSLAYFNSKFILLINALDHVYVSDDGEVWDLLVDLDGMFINSLLPLEDRMLAAAGFGSLYETMDGITWESIESGVSNHLVKLREFDGTLFACGVGGVILSSADGREWKSLLPVAPNRERLYAVASDGDTRIAVGNQRTLLRATPGSEWEKIDPSSSAVFYTVAYYQDQFVAAGSGGAIYTSPDGLEWTQRESPTTESLQRLSVANDRVFAGGWGGVLLSSTNGIEWTHSIVRTNLAVRPVLYKDGRYVAGGSRIGTAQGLSGQGGDQIDDGRVSTIMVSSNLVDWEGVQGDFESFDCGASGNGILLLAGAHGKVAISEDGLNWTETAEMVGSFEAAIFANGHFYLAGHPGLLMRSADGREWEAVRCATPHRIWGLGSTGDSLIAVGEFCTLGEAPFDVRFGPIDYANGTATVPVYGPGSGTLTVESSLDLKSWTPIATVGERANPHVMKLRASTRQFLRAVHSE